MTIAAVTSSTSFLNTKLPSHSNCSQTLHFHVPVPQAGWKAETLYILHAVAASTGDTSPFATQAYSAKRAVYRLRTYLDTTVNFLRPRRIGPVSRKSHLCYTTYTGRAEYLVPSKPRPTAPSASSGLWSRTCSRTCRTLPRSHHIKPTIRRGMQ